VLPMVASFTSDPALRPASLTGCERVADEVDSTSILATSIEECVDFRTPNKDDIAVCQQIQFLEIRKRGGERENEQAYRGRKEEKRERETGRCSSVASGGGPGGHLIYSTFRGLLSDGGLGNLQSVDGLNVGRRED
jgi:hypothetical protein